MLLMDILQQNWLVELTRRCTLGRPDMPRVCSRQCQQGQKAAKVRPPREHRVLGKACSHSDPFRELQPGHAAQRLASSHSVEGAKITPPSQAAGASRPHRPHLKMFSQKGDTESQLSRNCSIIARKTPSVNMPQPRWPLPGS